MFFLVAIRKFNLTIFQIKGRKTAYRVRQRDQKCCVLHIYVVNFRFMLPRFVMSTNKHVWKESRKCQRSFDFACSNCELEYIV